MQQQPPRPEVDLSALPEPLRRQLAEAQRLAAEAAAAQAAAPAATPAAAGPTGPRRLDDRQMLEAEAVRRRRLQDAFLRGSPGGYRSSPAPGRGLLAGLTLALGLALLVGLVAMVQATMAHPR